MYSMEFYTHFLFQASSDWAARLAQDSSHGEVKTAIHVTLFTSFIQKLSETKIIQHHFFLIVRVQLSDKQLENIRESMLKQLFLFMFSKFG